MSGPLRSDSVERAPAIAVRAWLPALLQMVLATGVVYLYGIEDGALLNVLALATAGFAVHALLPMAWRLPFFTLLSMAGVFAVFGPGDGAWLLLSGVALIGLANLPVPAGARVIVLVAAAAFLAASRAGVIPMPWSSAVWPILGSMFMFRLVLYVMAMKTDSPDRRPWWSLAYFFMLPNLVFPLFPVVDYQTFRRTYYDKDAAAIYDQGLLWIARGIVHLLLYRFIYHNAIIDAASVETLGDLAQFMLATLLLYLRVSGQFHLVVGLLHLFGFRLPETHKLYLLSRNFVELWRRINIYWTDFMMKTVFYPSYFKVKRRGPRAALVISTIAVFVATWILHSYQWFWIRGGFPLTPQDFAFWAILCGLVVAGGLRELGTTKKARTIGGEAGWNAGRGLQTAATFAVFCVLWSLWSTESVNTWLWTLGAAANVDLKGIALITISVGTIVLLGGVDWTARNPVAGGHVLMQPASRSLAYLLVLFAFAQPAIQAAMPGRMAGAVQALQNGDLNARDLALQHRGYYEELDVRAQLDTPVSADGRKRDASWQTLDELGVMNDRRDLMLRDLVPSARVTWNGRPFTTNQWGMRDRSYSRAKPPGTIRIALLGPSHVMGNNVADDEVFERLVEERINGASPAGRDHPVEILNFGVDGYSLPQQVALLEDRVFDFSPDFVIATHYDDNAAMTEGFLLKIATQGLPTPDGELKTLVEQAGLLDAGRAGAPIPFAFARNIAERAGIRTRMPYGEARSRARRLADEVLALSFRRFASLTRERGVAAAVLALNVVLEGESGDIPLAGVIEAAGLPVFDLFDVYPAAERPGLRVAPWDDHPNDKGHRIIADRLVDELTTFLASGALERARLARADN